MFQAVMSASAIGLPSPGVSAAADPAPKASTTARARTGLRIDMLDLPVALDAPARDAVVVLVGERQRGCHRLLGLAARGHELGARRLYVAGLVPGAALQDDRLAVPAPRHAEAGERFGKDRLLQRGLCPALAAIGRNHDLGNASVARIGNAGHLVEALLLQRVAEGGTGDERFDLLREVEQPHLVAGQDLRVGFRLVETHGRLVRSEERRVGKEWRAR